MGCCQPHSCSANEIVNLFWEELEIRNISATVYINKLIALGDSVLTKESFYTIASSFLHHSFNMGDKVRFWSKVHTKFENNINYILFCIVFLCSPDEPLTFTHIKKLDKILGLNCIFKEKIDLVFVKILLLVYFNLVTEFSYEVLVIPKDLDEYEKLNFNLLLTELTDQKISSFVEHKCKSFREGSFTNFEEFEENVVRMCSNVQEVKEQIENHRIKRSQRSEKSVKFVEIEKN